MISEGFSPFISIILSQRRLFLNGVFAITVILFVLNILLHHHFGYLALLLNQKHLNI